MPRLDTSPGQSKKARDDLDATHVRAREQAQLGKAIEVRLASTIGTYIRAKPEDAERLGCICAVDLHAAGYSPLAIAERLSVSPTQARAWLSNGLNALSQRAAVSAEIVRTSASEQLDSLYADLAELRRGELDQSAAIRAIEVQARIIGQRVDLYAAKVRTEDSNLADLAAEVLSIAGKRVTSTPDGSLAHHPDAGPTLTVQAEPEDTSK